MQFDTDSFPIGVDTYSSRCMSNDLDHYDDYEPFKKGGKVIVADRGTMEIKGKGTVTWKLEDDSRVVHTVGIKNTLLVPNLEHCLLSPQHLAKELEDRPNTTHDTQ